LGEEGGCGTLAQTGETQTNKKRNKKRGGCTESITEEPICKRRGVMVGERGEHLGLEKETLRGRPGDAQKNVVSIHKGTRGRKGKQM